MHLRKSFHTSHIFRWFLGLIQVANLIPGHAFSGHVSWILDQHHACTWDARQISSTFCQSKKKHNWDIWKLPCLAFFEVELWWCLAENRGEKPSRQRKNCDFCWFLVNRWSSEKWWLERKIPFKMVSCQGRHLNFQGFLGVFFPPWILGEIPTKQGGNSWWWDLGMHHYSNTGTWLDSLSRFYIYIYICICMCIYIFLYMYKDVPENSGTPRSSIFNRVFQCKPSILGYHYFWKHLYMLRNPKNQRI